MPAQLGPDSIREINALIHVENELIDEACGRVFDALVAAGLDDRTDIFYTSDHGEMQGDVGLLFKGPYHVESLLRVPLIWRPAPCATATSAQIEEPVGLVDLAPTFCRVAELDVPEWMEGAPLPVERGSSRRHVLTTFDSQFAAVGMHLRTIYRDGMLCTIYERSTSDQGGRFPFYWSVWGRGSTVPRYDGSEGELYDVREDPQQWHDRWSDPSRRRLRDELVEELRVSLPAARTPALPVSAPT